MTATPACSCGATAKTERLPAGWKRRGESVTCATCWGKKFVLRAITIPIAGPVCTEKPGMPGSEPLEWPILRERLRDSWIATTQAANMIIRRMACADPGIVDGKIAKMPKSYFYPEIRRQWPLLATCSVNSLEQAVQGKYRKARLDVALGKVSLPSMRYPVPIPVHNATWSVWEDDGGRLLVSFLLGGGRVTVRLRGGPGFRRQLVAVRKIIKGEALQGELSIYRVGASPGDHRNGDTPSTRVMVKMVAWLPRDDRIDGEALGLHTGGDAFLTMLDARQRQVIRWNRDDLRRRIAAQDDRMQRLREDLKAEKRLGRERDGILARMEMLERDNAHYMHTFCHQAAASVVDLAKRRRAGMLVYVDADRSYLPHFPWHKLAGLLAEKCEKAGIEFASGQATGESPEALASTGDSDGIE